MIKIARFICILCTLPFTILLSQTVTIEAKVSHLPAGKVFISEIRGEEHRMIDSLFVSGELIRLNLKDPLPGVYRITLGKSMRAAYLNEDPRFFDIIVNRESEIILETDFNFPSGKMNVVSSEENKLYYTFLQLYTDYRKKLGHLLPLFSVYSTDDPFYPDFKAATDRLQRNYTDSILVFSERLPGSLVSSIMKFSLLPAVDPSVGFAEMTAFLKVHFFDLVTFTDERLIRSQVFTQKIIEYLGLFGNNSLTQSEQEMQYISAVDLIMERASYNEKVFDFVLGFLVDGFDRLKMENVLVHLAENYVEKGCETENKKIMEQRLSGYKKMAAGNIVNDIVLLDQNGKSRRLTELKNKYVLVVFWATWCPHCSKLLPDIKSWYMNNPDIDLGIYSVSIDTSRFEWEEHLLMNDYPFINVCNFQGWEGKVAADYNIYATPTMFILDRNRKILSKPLTFREFRREIERIVSN